VVKSITRLLVFLVAAAAIGAVYLASTKEPATKQAGGKRGGGGGAVADPPVPVTGTEAKVTDVPVFLEGVGTAKALNTVTVKPQADGRILKIHFREGQTVTKGDLLAEIDPTTYKAALDQVVAKRALTETQLTNARRDSERFARIPGVVAQKTVDTQSALVAQLEAQSRADTAAIASAQAVLDYTRVTAPATGRTGLRLIDEGNLVRAGADTGLVTITQVQPISVIFNLPQQQLQRITRAQSQGAVAVDALDTDGKAIVDKGTLQVVDNQVDQTTGTVKMKADFPNANMQLWPGQFVNVRLLVETLQQVVVVPTPAVQRGPNGPFVYLVGADDRAKVRLVELSLQTESESVIKSGLGAGDRVITSGFARMQDNARVVFGRQGGDVRPPATGPALGPVTVPGAPPGPTASGTSAGDGSDAEARARQDAFRQICATDLQTHCAAVPRDAMRQCIAANAAKFSAPCQAAVAERQQRDGDGKRAGGQGRRPPSDSAVPGSAASVPSKSTQQ
jgi:membrane fusion protein, multidrug efflux system